MKVCMLAYGAMDYAVALSLALTETCEVDFYCSRHYLEGRDPSIIDVLANRCEVHVFPHRRIRDPRNFLVSRDLCRTIASRDYDVIHIQEYSDPWTSFWWGRDFPPLVMTMHDPYQHPGLAWRNRRYQDRMQSIFTRRARHVICHGMPLKEQVLRRYGFIQDKDVTVIPLGNLDLLKDLGAKSTLHAGESAKTILFFGEVRRNKGLEYLLQAEALMRARITNYRIVVAGLCDDMERYTPWLSPESRVTFDNRFIPNSEIAAYFENAGAVVLPYVSGTQSGVIPLAYTFGKPVVATRVGALPELVEEGKTGLLVPPENPEALADALVQMLSSEERLQTMGTHAERYCREHLSWDSIASKTKDVYRRVLESDDA
jgi:glycosyltransferase involved in cell wall biosynthesis